MKKLPFLLFRFYLLFSSKFLWAQMPVTDLGVATSIVQQIKAIEESTAVLEKSKVSLEQMKKTLESSQAYLQKASSYIHKLNYFKKAQHLYSKALAAQKKTNWLLKKVYKNFDSEKKLENTLSYTSSLLENLHHNLSFIQDLLKEGNVQMSDFERLTYLDQKEKDIEEKTSQLEEFSWGLENEYTLEEVISRIK